MAHSTLGQATPPQSRPHCYSRQRQPHAVHRRQDREDLQQTFAGALGKFPATSPTGKEKA